MCSPPSSGSSSATVDVAVPWGRRNSGARGTRTGRPSVSRPLVARPISTVRFSAIGPRLGNLPSFSPRQPLANFRRKLVVRLGDGQLFHGVVGFRIRVQRLAHLLAPGEPAT